MNIFSITITTVSPNATMIKTVQEWAGESRRHLNAAFDRIVKSEMKIAGVIKCYSRLDSSVISTASGGKVIVTQHFVEILDD
jgi:hypothetical protein